MEFSSLDAISPVDGRYRPAEGKTGGLFFRSGADQVLDPSGGRTFYRPLRAAFAAVDKF